MVCPNCHSDQIIKVQDQHFCINCGQMVPDQPPISTKKSKGAGVAVQDNGLPEGVKIIPMTPSATPPDLTGEGRPIITTTPEPVDAPNEPINAAKIIKPRKRIAAAAATTELSEAKPDKGETSKPKKRKPGRPKAGRLDTPRIAVSPITKATVTATESVTIKAPTAIASPLPSTSMPIAIPNSVPRRMNDLAPRRAAHTPQHATKTPSSNPTPKAIAKANRHPKHHQVHKVGIPPLHFGAILAFSLRTRLHPKHLFLATLAPMGFAAAIAYSLWLILNGGLPRLAGLLTDSGPQLILELVILAMLYYIGRSVGQAAITFGVAREADARPVPLSRQIGIGINTFGRRLVLDIVAGLFELLILILMGVLLLTGGGDWPVNPQLQVAAIFCSFLVLLYLITGLGLARGLAGVALTLTPRHPWAAAKLGWRLFSHRFELLGLRFLAVALELLLALPLAALGLALVVAVPASLQPIAILGIAILAWLAGALLGAGTASWWTALYRRLVQVDQPTEAEALTSSRPPADANRGPLVLLVALSSFLIAAALALPWLKLF